MPRQSTPTKTTDAALIQTLAFDYHQAVQALADFKDERPKLTQAIVDARDALFTEVNRRGLAVGGPASVNQPKIVIPIQLDAEDLQTFVIISTSDTTIEIAKAIETSPAA